jgi:hypothetical protein
MRRHAGQGKGRDRSPVAPGRRGRSGQRVPDGLLHGLAAGAKQPRFITCSWCSCRLESGPRVTDGFPVAKPMTMSPLPCAMDAPTRIHPTTARRNTRRSSSAAKGSSVAATIITEPPSGPSIPAGWIPRPAGTPARVRSGGHHQDHAKGGAKMFRSAWNHHCRRPTRFRPAIRRSGCPGRFRRRVLTIGR